MFRIENSSLSPVTYENDFDSVKNYVEYIKTYFDSNINFLPASRFILRHEHNNAIRNCLRCNSPQIALKRVSNYALF